jgi:hypothetical protein
MHKSLIPLALAGLVGVAEAAVVVKPVPYEIDGEAFEGMLIVSVQPPHLYSDCGAEG